VKSTLYNKTRRSVHRSGNESCLLSTRKQAY